MFSTLAGGRRYPGSISHRHKHVTFGKVAIGIAKGTAMIVIGVPVCTIAAGIGATAIVAYGLASPFYYGGKKLVKKIRRQVRKKEELACTDRLTREDILIWLENCDDDPDSLHSEAAPAEGRACGVPASDGAADAGAGVSGTSAPVASPSFSAATGQRKKPALRRLFSRESRGFVLMKSATGGLAAGDEGNSGGGAGGACGGASRADYQRLVNEPDYESDTEANEQEELWKEMEHVVHRLRQDRLSICPENVVSMDKPLILESSCDMMQFIRKLQLEGHLRQLTRAASLPALSQQSALGSAPSEEDLLSSLPQHRTAGLLSVSVHKRYLRTVSDNGGLASRGIEVG